MTTTAAAPEAALGVLPRADGSANYSHAGYTVTGSVNGPIEAQRRDEHAYEAHVDVVIRPAAGVGGTRERHLESILQSSLTQLILVKNFPRCLVQIVLQVEDSPENDYVNTKLVQASLNFAIMPALMQTAVLALLSAGVPMRATATATAIAVMRQEEGAPTLVVDPSTRAIETAQSAHVLAFTSHGGLLLAESEGDFTVKEWDSVYDTAREICCRSAPTKEGMEMVLDEEATRGPDMRQFLQSTMEAKVAKDLHWK
ncbi:uncharacterized protein C8A04DRAFT_24490 [Dichotomopilus funicola]|uniref:Exoribonuclease phosphorolytic domain-containing protein n=1 Tax=Dichotomopilus funicola TaxID=1934379 RepID=A0AAN6VAK5_9PEZI|nr:hypothetical protein C8A04DRAFT_24490 [Dichotomopilus funicola]